MFAYQQYSPVLTKYDPDQEEVWVTMIYSNDSEYLNKLMERPYSDGRARIERVIEIK